MKDLDEVEARIREDRAAILQQMVDAHAAETVRLRRKERTSRLTAMEAHRLYGDEWREHMHWTFRLGRHWRLTWPIYAAYAFAVALGTAVYLLVGGAPW